LTKGTVLFLDETRSSRNRTVPFVKIGSGDGEAGEGEPSAAALRAAAGAGEALAVGEHELAGQATDRLDHERPLAAAQGALEVGEVLRHVALGDPHELRQVEGGARGLAQQALDLLAEGLAQGRGRR
jgi:hypothetical protein